jgi:ring-1,2-phenylacetyl-CoA epoxidase subunit PaaE
MSIHFHPLRIKEIRQETNDCISLVFDVPAQLSNQFKFKQGQSLTMRTTLNDEEVRRTYSICSSPIDNEWRVAIKKVDGGVFSNYAHSGLKAGDILEVMPPVGSFYTELSANHSKHYLAFAAGSGITPVLSLIKTTLAVEPNSSFTLVFGNQNRASIIFFEELEALKNKYIDRFNLIYLLSRERTDSSLNYGRIDKDKLIDLSKLLNYSHYHEFFICGPEQMIFTVKDFLSSVGIDNKRIHFELFTTPGVASAKSTISATVLKKASVTVANASKITVKLDGRSFDYDLPLGSGATILESALQQGVDLPYACKGGVCCTCKAKLLEGKVEMDVHWGLEDEEIEQGYILTCQSHPTTSKVVVDFDIK